MKLFIGIDDTDNLHSRGTGYRARCLAALLEEESLARRQGITRHQLLVSPEIPYTSHNSSACLEVTADTADLPRLSECCRDFLSRESAPGSDAGLCITCSDQVNERIQSFGQRAKKEVLNQAAAIDVATAESLLLEGLTGDHGGIIGALAAIGLHTRGQDGRFIWLRGIREHQGERMRLAELWEKTGIDRVQCLDGTPVSDPEDIIDLGPWARPVLLEWQAVLLVEACDDTEYEDSQWRVVPKEIIKRY